MPTPQAIQGHAAVDREAVQEAIAALDRGELIGFPTETVYGVAARADRPAALSRLREVRSVSEDHAFALHVADPDQAAEVLGVEEVSHRLRRLMSKIFPGPVTLRLRVTTGFGTLWPEASRVGLTSGGWAALRCPDSSLTRAVLRGVDGPVVGASATAPGKRPAVEVSAARSALRDVASVVLDGGTSRFGRPSTLARVEEVNGRLVVDVQRPGVIDQRMIDRMLTMNLLMVCTGNTCRSPMAEAIARDLLKNSPEFEVSSAGVFAGDGTPASIEAVEAMRLQGLDLRKHRSRALTLEMVRAADRVYTMTESHRQAVLALSPGLEAKVQCLDPDGDIRDPIGSDQSVYQATATQIRGALERRLKEQQS